MIVQLFSFKFNFQSFSDFDEAAKDVARKTDIGPVQVLSKVAAQKIQFQDFLRRLKIF